MNIKFYKFESSFRDLDLFLEISEKSLNFETGDGIHGQHPPEGSQIIIETQFTRGDAGNVPNSEFIITDVMVDELKNINSGDS